MDHSENFFKLLLCVGMEVHMNVCSWTNRGQRAPLGVFPQELFTLFPEIGSLTGDLELAE